MVRVQRDMSGDAADWQRGCREIRAWLRTYHDRNWFFIRPCMFASAVASRHSPASAIDGRTNTRSGRGKVHMRWHDGAEYAQGL